MADKKITQLNNITGADLADADEFVVVDITSDETKAITFNELKTAFDTGTGFVRVTGDTMTGNLSFGDNDKAIFGAGSDLQIYHDGSNSHIKDTATGNLNISGNDIQILNAASNEAMAYFAQDGDVTLYHNGVAKLATKSTGIQVTGNIANASGDFTLDVAGSIVLDADSGEVDIADGGTVIGRFRNVSSNLRIQSIAQDKDIQFVGNDGGSDVTALTLDMSEAGAATFNSTVTAAGLTVDLGTVDTVATFQSSGDANAYIVVKDSGSSGGAFIGAVGTHTILGTGGSTERMRIDSSGSVGIGTSSPSFPLSVQANSNAQGLLIIGRSSDDIGEIGFYENDNSTNLGEIQYRQDHVNFRHRVGDIRFATGGTTERMRIDSSGNVGIGTSSPSNKLDVKGTVGFEATNSTNKWLAYTYTDNTFRLNYNGAGADEVVITSTGRVGIGTSSPSTKLTVLANSANGIDLAQDPDDGTNSGRLFFTTSGGSNSIRSTSGALQFSTGATAGSSSGTERMRIDSSGNLLVGKTSANNTDVGTTIYSTLGFSSTRSGGVVGIINRTTNDGDIMQFRKDGTTVGSIGTHASNITIGTGATGLRFYDTDNVIMPRNPSTGASVNGTISLGEPLNRFKNLYLSGGVYLGGTGSANYLDDYEEGTWTLTDQSGAGLSLTVYVATYTKIGNQVFFEFGIVFPTTSNTSAIKLLLPFLVKNSADNTGGGAVTTTSSGRNDSVVALRNASLLALSTNLNTNVTNANYSGKQLRVAGQYTTSA